MPDGLVPNSTQIPSDIGEYTTGYCGQSDVREADHPGLTVPDSLFRIDAAYFICHARVVDSPGSCHHLWGP